eukprot:354460-Chlamydomonas_euryale.AAC.2
MFPEGGSQAFVPPAAAAGTPCFLWRRQPGPPASFGGGSRDPLLPFAAAAGTPCFLWRRPGPHAPLRRPL